MLQRFLSSQHRLLVVALLGLFLWTGRPQAVSQNLSPGIDFFSGVDFNFRDINYNTQYEFLIRLSPGFKWDMGNHWQLSGQVLIPIVNQYGIEYSFFQVNALNVSKEFKIKNLYFKTTAGVFSHNRYGLDLKAFLPLCDWFAFEGQAGYIGSVFMSPYWEIVAPNRFVGTIGGDFYLSQWNTQFRGIIGKYLYGDTGCELEAMRHFNHTTVSIYGRWNNANGFDGGFRCVIMLPPYHRKHKVVNIRPASNFRLSYEILNHQYNNRMYRTDPEQNERDGWFSRDFLQWGSHTMKPDFIIKDLRKKKE
jgi:hypothetical protein